MRRRFAVFVMAVIGLSAFAAEPYEKMKVGIMGGLSTAIALKVQEVYAYKDLSIGAQLHITPLVSIRPSFILYTNEEKYTDVMAGDPEYAQDKDSYFGVQLDVPLHLLRFSDGSFYAGPSVAYMSASQKTYNLAGTTSYLDYEYQYGIFSIGAIVGGQYQPSRHFGVFLDLGFDYLSNSMTYKNYDNTGATTANETTAISKLFFRGAMIGAILYVN